MNRTIRFAAAVLIAVLVAIPMFAARGSADFTRFVALGDSYGAGVESSSLNERHQPWSWPAIIARQAGLTLCPPTATAADNCWAQPLVSYPGIGPELQLVNLTGTIEAAPGSGVPLMTTFARPYNNLSIPGGTLGSTLVVTGGETPQAGEPTPVSFSRFILRGQGTAVQQAIAQHPTFIAMFVGGNDYLNFAFSGNPATVPSKEEFKARLEAILDALVAGAPNAGIVVGNYPFPSSLVPYLTLIPPVLVDPATRQPVLIGGQPVFYIADLGNGVIGPVPATTLIPLGTRAKLAQGYGLPPQLKNIPPFSSLPHTGEPLSANDIITIEEVQAVGARVAEFNTILAQAAAARDIPVADIKGLFERVASGIQLGPIRVSAAFVTGGFYSLDGFHLTDLGYLLFADEYIKTINAAYGTEIPLASITQLFANNGAFFGEGVPSSQDLTVSPAAAEMIRDFWGPKSTVMRRRAAVH